MKAPRTASGRGGSRAGRPAVEGRPRLRRDPPADHRRQRTPGERLVIEHLAREINVSVVPVREAIRRLEAEGYVTFTRNVGATVASIDLERYPETIEAVAVLEGVATGLAAPHLTATDLKKARALNEELRAHARQARPRPVHATNAQFHETLYGAAPTATSSTWSCGSGRCSTPPAARRSRSSPSGRRGSVEEHEELVD